MTTTWHLWRLERQLRGRAHESDLHGAAVRAWIAARQMLRERGIEPPPPEQRPGWRRR